MALVPFPNKSTTPVATDEVDPDWDDQDSSEEGGKMSFLEHLDELRRRIIYSVAAIFGGFLIAFTFVKHLEAFVMAPMSAMMPAGRTLIFTEPTEMFFLLLKIAAIAGVLIASPVVMTQVWLFISPGLYSHEKKMAVPFVVLTSVFFVTGALFSHFVVFPVSFQFFIGLESEFARAEIRVAPAFALWAKLLFAFGLVFQMPTLVLFLSKLGLITPQFMLRNFKYAFLIIFVIAAVITPPDVVSQVLMGVPMVGLYMLSVGIAWMFQKKRRADEE